MYTFSLRNFEVGIIRDTTLFISLRNIEYIDKDLCDPVRLYFFQPQYLNQSVNI